MRYTIAISRRTIIDCATWNWWRKNDIVNSPLHFGGDVEDVARICVRCAIENNACCEHILARVIIGINGRIANSRRIDTRICRIGRYWRREFEEGISNIHYKFVREWSGSLPSEGASAAVFWGEFMAKGFGKKNERIKVFRPQRSAHPRFAYLYSRSIREITIHWSPK